MNDKFKCRMIFENKLVDSQAIESWFEDMCFFIPLKMSGRCLTNNYVKKYNKRRLYKGIKQELESGQRFSMSIEDGKNIMQVVKYKDHTSINLLLEKDLFIYNKNVIVKWIDDCMEKYNGIVSYIYSIEDRFWQNHQQLETYYFEKRSRDNIVLNSKKDKYNRPCVDIEHFPGHDHYVNDIWFGASWMMWFGKGYYDYVAKDSLKTFEKCFENVEITQDVIRITLYDNMLEYDKKENREKQWEFRTHNNIDEIAHKLLNKKNPSCGVENLNMKAI